MKIGSLFDGAGTFPFAAQQYGVHATWASEIESFPIAVTSKRFPQMKHLGDITKINGADIEPVDIITFGSPCQDLSVAGKRAGLAGERSGLFMEAVRIIKEMLEVTNGEYPKIAIWENVPGAFSSNKGEDFRVVLEELCKIKKSSTAIPRPKNGKWNDSGFIMGGGFSLAWRILDAQFWGVPQRRRRIFLVADFGGGSAGQILFERDGLSRNFAESREAWKGITRNSAFCTYATRECYDARGNGNGEIAPTIVGNHNDSITDYSAVIVEGFDMYNQSSTGLQIQDSRGIGNYYENKSVTLTNGTNPGWQMGVCVLTNFEYWVRRVIPTECARLQGMPDWWCSDIPHTDSAEYKMWGNGMALPCAMYVMENVVRILRDRLLSEVLNG